jgi:hypothetical protein
MIQRGTNHAWANRSDRRARVAFVLIDAQPLGIIYNKDSALGIYLATLPRR